MSNYSVQYVLNLKDRVSGQLGDIQNKVSKFDQKIGGLGGTIAGALAVGSIVEFGQAAINAALEAEAVDARLTNAAKSLTNANNEQVQSMLNLADAMQKKTRFGDEDIKNQMTAMMQYGMSRKQVEEFIPVITDFAAATGISLDEATNAVISGTNGMTRGLKKYGLELNLTGDKAADAAQIIGQLNAKFGGAAAADLETNAGKVAQLKEQWGNFQEAIGADLFERLNWMSTTFKALTGDMDAMRSMIDNISNMSFMDFVSKGNPLIGALRAMGENFGIIEKDATAADMVIANSANTAKMFEMAITSGGQNMEKAYLRVAEVFGLTRAEFEKYVKVYQAQSGKPGMPVDNSVAALEDQLSQMKKAQKEVSTRGEFLKKQKDIDKLQGQIDKITGKKTPTGAGARAGAGATSSTLTSRSPQTFNINITKLVETINTTKPQLNTTDSQTMRQITEALVMAVNDVQTTVQ
jgi:hypothetical protein